MIYFAVFIAIRSDYSLINEYNTIETLSFIKIWKKLRKMNYSKYKRQ